MISKKQKFAVCLLMAQLIMAGCASSIDMRAEENDPLAEFKESGSGEIEPVVASDKTLAPLPPPNEAYCFDLEEPVKEETLGSEAFAYECPDLSASPLIVYCENGCQTVCASFAHLASDDRCKVVLYPGELETDAGDAIPEQIIPVDSQPAEETAPQDSELPTSDKDEIVEPSKEPSKNSDEIANTTNRDSDMKDSSQEGGVDNTQDTSCPTVVSSIPPDGATGVGGDILVFCFDEPMDPASFAVEDLLINPVTPVASVSTSNNCVAYKLEKPLFCGPIEYQINLVGGVGGPTDAAKNPLCAPFSIHFFTAKCAPVTDPIPVNTDNTVTATDVSTVSTDLTSKDGTLTTSLDTSKDTIKILTPGSDLSKISTSSSTTNTKGTTPDTSKDSGPTTGTVVRPVTKSSTNSTTIK